MVLVLVLDVLDHIGRIYSPFNLARGCYSPFNLARGCRVPTVLDLDNKVIGTLVFSRKKSIPELVPWSTT